MQHISTLKITLQPVGNQSLTPLQANELAPFFQGFLMSSISSEVAEHFHALPFNPYSTRCTLTPEKDGLVWNVTALTDETAEEIIHPLQKTDSIHLKANDTTYAVAKQELETVGAKTLTDLISAPGQTKIEMNFVTPCSFKSAGRYVFVPTVRLVFQNLLMHYCQVYESDKEVDPETLSYIDQHVHVVSYNLRSRYFGNIAEGKRKIPGFMGTMGIALRGPQPLQGLVRMLVAFGGYAGVGIKTSMGMGGMEWR